MFGRNEQRHIALHLPTSWNRCTTDELEAIAAAIIKEQQRVDRYHPFDWQRVKLNVVLAVNNLHVVSMESPTNDDDTEHTFIVNRSKEEGDFPISTGQMLALTEQLAWIDDEKADKTIFAFPYSMMTVSGKTADHKMTVAGPPPLLDGYTWREYRWLTDWMQAYMRHSNTKNAEAAAQAQREFLAVLFKPADGCDTAVNATLFAEFSPVKWQVVLFWWSSLMAQLAKKFPKVFKSQPVGKGKRKQQQRDTPWDFYNRVTATIQKYVGGLSAKDVDDQPYGVTLQQLEMMAYESAEMEKIKNKK